MIYDGAPSASLYGLDIEGRFISLGYDLFLDRGKLDSKFIVGDVFDMDLGLLEGKFDIVHASAFFHLFPRPKQLLAVQKMISILRSEPGSMVFGAHLGSLEPAEYELKKGGPLSFRHNPESFAELWREAGSLSGTRWEVECTMDMVGIAGNEKMGWAEPNIKRIVFTVTRN